MKSEKFTFLKAVVFGLFLTHTLNACSQSPPDYSGSTSVRMYRNSDTDVMTLNIPKGYLDGFVLSGPPVPGAKEDTAEIKTHMFFAAEAGTLKPRSADNNQAFVYPNSLTDQFSFNISSWSKREAHECYMYRQRNYASRLHTFTFSCATPPVARPRFGLDWYEGDRSNCPMQLAIHPTDMLIERDAGGGVKTLLFCTSDVVPDLSTQLAAGQLISSNPRCEHLYYFEALNVTVILDYSRFYVKDWRALEQRINTLLLSFVQTPSNP